MKLRRIAVTGFRKLDHAVIEEIGDGLTLVVGDNEAGKSTLLAALRAALFERHKVTGAAVEAMMPYGGGGRPEVELGFIRHGTEWRLKKAFGKRPEALLIGGGGSYRDDAADEKLAELLDFQPSQRGGANPEANHGIFGLLWVEQGTAHGALRVGAGRERLATALEREVGQVTGGDRGRVLLAMAEERRERYWDKRGNPRGAVRELMQRLEADRTERDRLAEQLRGFDEKVDRMKGLAETRDRHRRNGTLETARASLEAAETAAAGIARLGEQLRIAETEFDTARLRREATQGARQLRTDLGTAFTEARAGHDAARAAAEEAMAAGRRAEAASRTAGEKLEAAERRRLAASEALRRLERSASVRQARAALAHAQGLAAQVGEAEKARQAARARAAAIGLDGAALKRLEALAQAADTAQARLTAASVRLTLMPDFPGTSVLVDGRPVTGAEVTLSADGVLTLEGYGRIAVHPGGGVAALAGAVEQAEAALGAALAERDLPDLATAQARLADRQAAEAEARSHTDTIAALAPRGTDALMAEIARIELSLADAGPETGHEDAEALPAARRRLAEAEDETRRLRDEMTLNSETAQRAREAFAVAEDRMRAARAAVVAAEAALTRARTGLSDVDLVVALQRDVQAETAARQGLDLARRAFEAASPEAAELELERARAAVASITEDIARTERDLLTLETELRTLGTHGLGEALAEIEGRIEADAAALAMMQREAEAARLLHETLATAQRETRELWLKPVQERAAPYLRLIVPDAEVSLDETTLELSGITRNGQAERYEGLSVGAREQVAVITRLALADLLREAGEEACVVLDDALVNTDEARLRRMHLVLSRAAHHQQILIMTCREKDFIQLGAPIRRM